MLCQLWIFGNWLMFMPKVKHLLLHNPLHPISQLFHPVCHLHHTLQAAVVSRVKHAPQPPSLLWPMSSLSLSQLYWLWSSLYCCKRPSVNIVKLSKLRISVFLTVQEPEIWVSPPTWMLKLVKGRGTSQWRKTKLMPSLINYMTFLTVWTSIKYRALLWMTNQ